jgi:hypothetical protein
MSFKLMGEALSIKTGSCITKMILLKLCDNANDNGECWPSYSTMASHCEVSKRTVISHIRILIDMGIVVKKTRKESAKNKTNLYTIHLNGSESPALGSESPALGGGAAPAPKPISSLEPIKEKDKKEISQNFKIEAIEAWKELGGVEYLPDKNFRAFLSRWLESNKSGKMRFESEKFFEMKRRLATWKRNAENWGNIVKLDPNVRRNP